MQQLRGKNLKRVLCLLLAFVMVLTLFPAAALGVAEEGADVAATPVAAEEGPIGIEPLSVHRPAGVPDVAPAAYHVVTTEAQLRTALGAAQNPRVIRLDNDITLATAAALPLTGSGHVVHIYSNSPESFSINRGTSTSRHFSLAFGDNAAGTRTFHIWNVALTRNPGMTTDGGGIFLNAARVHIHMHAGSEISNNRAAGRGGGINIDAGTVTLNAGALIDNNQSNHASASGSSSGGGGGVSINSGSPASTLNVNGATISNNIALRGHGGGIQVAAGTSGARAVLNINSIYLLNNEARLNAAGTAGGNGGGIHSNGHSTITIAGVSTIEGNRANNGGAMRIFSASYPPVSAKSLKSTPAGGSAP